MKQPGPEVAVQPDAATELSPREKLEALVTSGRISAEDGARLARALDRAPPRASWVSWLHDPFERLSTRVGVGVGVAVTLAQLALGRADVRFDGALDVHRGAQPWSRAVLEQLIAWPLTATLLWLIALLFARRSRWLDFLVTVGVARTALVAVAAIAVAFLPASVPTGEAVSLAQRAHLLLGLLVLPFVAWFLVLLFRGVKAASGLEGGRLWAAFLVGVVAAELASKALLAIG
jgi:hypothetical protein